MAMSHGGYADEWKRPMGIGIDCIPSIAEREDKFVEDIDPDLIRRAKINGISSEELLVAILQPLTGYLATHISPPDPNPRKHSRCFWRMVSRLGERMNKIHCPPWIKLVEVTIIPSGFERVDTHILNCEDCQRDLNEIRSRLPNYREFYMR